MGNLRDEILTAYKEDNFLQIVYNKSIGDQEDRNGLSDTLAALHKEGLIDFIDCFQALVNKSNNSYNFFGTLRVFKNTLPHIDALVKPVMDCVIHLYNEAGNDGSASDVFKTFIIFCAAEPARPKESLELIENNIDCYVDLLMPTIVAGSRINIEDYFNEAIRLANHDNIEIRKRAIFSLGRIQYPDDTDLIIKALNCLELSSKKETDDHLLGNLIKSAFSLYKLDKSMQERINDLINFTLSNGNDLALNRASEIFCSDNNEFPESMLKMLFMHFRHVKPQNNVTLNQIDYGLSNLIRKDNTTIVIEFLEGLLLDNSKEISLEIFDSVIRELIKNHKVLNRLLTRWFTRGDRVLCEGISAIVNNTRDNNMLLGVDHSELDYSDPMLIFFLARKSIGYLFSKPITVASIIISLIRITDDKDTIDKLGKLLFDPMLLNYTGKLKEFLISLVEKESGKIKSSIEVSLRYFDEYMDNLKSTGEIPELHPPQEHRDAYMRYMSYLTSEFYKEAEKQTVILSLIPKCVILYGDKSINYVIGIDGKTNRTEIPLQRLSIEMELPRIEQIDSFSFHYILHIFRAEKYKT